MLSTTGRAPKPIEPAWDGRFRSFFNEQFALLDVSTNADWMGVSFAWFNPRNVDDGDYVFYKIYGAQDTDEDTQELYPLQVQGLDLVGEGRFVRAFTVPQISWEPHLNITAPQAPGDPNLGFNFFPNDGGPTRLFNDNTELVAIAPLPKIEELLAYFHADQDGFTGALFTLSFGLKAFAEFNKNHAYHPDAKLERNQRTFRVGSGYVYRHDSGWQAETPGLYDYSYRVKLTPTDPPVKKNNPFRIHPGIIKGVHNVQNITETPEIPVFERVWNKQNGDKYIDDAGVEQTVDGSTPDVFRNPTVKLQPVYFDADVDIEFVRSGAVKGKVASKGMLGYVQLGSKGEPIPDFLFRDLLNEQFGSLGGPVDCVIDIGDTGQQMRLTRVYVSQSVQADNVTPAFVATARGTAILPKDGAWSVVQYQHGSGEVTPLPANTTAPLIKKGVLGTSPDTPLRIENPMEMERPAIPSSVHYGLLQSTGTQKALFRKPRFKKNVAELLSDTSDFADAYRMLNSSGIFPNLEDAIPMELGSFKTKIIEEGYKLLDEANPEKILEKALPDGPWYIVDEGFLKIYIEYDKRDNPTNPLKLEAGLFVGVYFNEVFSLTGNPLLDLPLGYPDAATTGPAFADAMLAFEARIMDGLGQFPAQTAPHTVFSLGAPAAAPDARDLFTEMQNQFQIKNTVATAVLAEAPKKEIFVKKYLTRSYRRAFNFTRPRVPEAVTDDSYHCAVKEDKPKNPAFQPTPDEVTWGKVYAYCLRHPLLARRIGLIREMTIPVLSGLLEEGGFLYVTLADGSDYLLNPGSDDQFNFIRHCAVRIPALEVGTARPLFSPVQFSVLFGVAAPDGNYDQVFIEASDYDDGFAKIVHANQPVSQNLLAEEDDGFSPLTDIGVRLGWDDEQVLIWLNRQLREQAEAPGSGKRLDASMGVFAYRVDVREDGEANWIPW